MSNSNTKGKKNMTLSITKQRVEQTVNSLVEDGVLQKNPINSKMSMEKACEAFIGLVENNENLPKDAKILFNDIVDMNQGNRPADGTVPVDESITSPTEEDIVMAGIYKLDIEHYMNLKASSPDIIQQWYDRLTATQKRQLPEKELTDAEKAQAFLDWVLNAPAKKLRNFMIGEALADPETVPEMRTEFGIIKEEEFVDHFNPLMAKKSRSGSSTVKPWDGTGQPFKDGTLCQDIFEILKNDGPTHMDEFMKVLENHNSSADKPDVYVSTIKRKVKRIYEVVIVDKIVSLNELPEEN